MIDCIKIIQKYYHTGEPAYNILVSHSSAVARKALCLARRHPELELDLDFVYEGAMLHDIGIRWCDAHDIGCFGTESYICHGVIGARLLRDNEKGLERHACVCERHTGTGITIEAIRHQNLPLPLADYSPVTLEEKIICYADKFFSKTHLDRERTPEQVVASMARFGEESVRHINEFQRLFG